MSEELNNTQDNGGKDWFYGRLNESIEGNYADILNDNSDVNFELKSADTYLKDPQISGRYKETYGDKYKEKFKEHYKKVAQDYQNYESGNFNKTAYSRTMWAPGTSFLGGGRSKEWNPSVVADIQLVPKRLDLGVDIFDHTTIAAVDPRAADAASKTYQDLEGNTYKMPTKEEVYDSWRKANPYEFVIGDDGDKGSGMTYMINNPAITNKEGKKQIGWVYQDDLGGRRKPGYVAVFEDQYDKVLDRQAVSTHDAYNGDFSMKADPWDFAGRSISNTITGLHKMIATAGMAMDTAINGNKAVNDWGATMLRIGGNEVSTALKTQEGGAFGTWDGAAGLVSDVVIQLMTGRAFGTLGAGIGAAIDGARGVELATTTAKLAKMGAISGMSLYGAKDMYHSALAQGYSAREASALFAGSFGAMLLVNKAMNGLEDAWTAQRVAKAVNNSVLEAAEKTGFKETLKNSMQALAEEGIDKEAKKKIASELFGKISSSVSLSKALTKINSLSQKSGVAGYLGGAVQEGTEETAELLGDEAVKHIVEGVKALGFYTPEDNKKGHFKTMFDEGYWEGLGDEIVNNFAAGAVGGALTKTPMFKRILGDKEDETLTNEWHDLIAQGKDAGIPKAIEELHSKGVLGDTKYSTIFDPETKTYVPLNQAPQGTRSMNDAARDVLLQQYHFLKYTIGNLGTDRALDFVKNNKDFLDNTSVLNDIRDYNKEYVDIALKYNIDEANKPSDKLYITDEDTPETINEKVEKYSKLANVDEEVAKRIIEIHSAVNDIKSGKAAQKYFLQYLSKNTTLDPDSPTEFIEDYQNHFGKNILNNLMSAAHRDLEKSKEQEDSLKDIVSQNEKIINDLKPDLSNIDTVLNLIKNDNTVYLSEKSKDKILDLINNSDLDQNSIGKIKQQYEKRLSEEYSEDKIKETPFYRNLVEKNVPQETLDKYIVFANAYLSKLAELRIASIKDSKSLRAFKFPKLGNGNLPSYIHLTTPVGPPTELVDDFVKLRLDVLNSKSEEDLTKLAELYAKNTNNELSEISTQLISFENPFIQIANSAKIYNPNEYKASDILNTLLKGFSGNDQEVNNTLDLQTIIQNIKDSKEKTNLDTPGSMDMYADVNTVASAFYQNRARLDQARILYNAFSKKENNNVISDFEAKLNSILSGASYKEEVKGEGNLFKDLPLHSARFFALRDKEIKTPEEQEELDNLINYDFGAIEKAYEQLAKNNDELISLLQGTIEASKNIGDADVHMASFVETIEAEEKVITDLLGIYEALNPNEEANELFIKFKNNSSNIDRLGSSNIQDTFNTMWAVKNYFYNLGSIAKKELLDKYHKFLLQTEGSQLILKNTEDFRLAAMFTELDLNNYYRAYTELIDENPNLFGNATGEQDAAIMATVAHLVSNVAQIFSEKSDIDKINNLDYTGVLLGVQGSGKSSYVLCTALKIAEKMKGNQSKEILLASNLENQIKVLKKTTNKFGVNNVSNKTFTSTRQTNKSLQPEDLIKFLSDKGNLENIDTIIYDEATYIQYVAGDAKTNAFENRSALSKINSLITNINKDRKAENKPLLKLLLMGDNTQNGFRKENGVKENIDSAAMFYKSPKLMYNHRNKIRSMNTFLRTVVLNLNSSDTSNGIKNLDKLEAAFGPLKGIEGDYLGGINFNTIDPSKLNDEYNSTFFDHVREKIENSKKALDEDEFSVGVILSDIDDNFDNTKLAQLKKDFPTNVTITDHDSVQGGEFDYVFIVVSEKNIGAKFNKAKIQEESAAASKLATSIGRCRYYAHVINTSPRDFKSKLSDDIFITEESLNENLVALFKNLKHELFTNIPGQLNEVLATTTDEDAASRLKQEELEKARILKEQQEAEIIKENNQKFYDSVEVGQKIEFLVESTGNVVEGVVTSKLVVNGIHHIQFTKEIDEYFQKGPKNTIKQTIKLNPDQTVTLDRELVTSLSTNEFSEEEINTYNPVNLPEVEVPVVEEESKEDNEEPIKAEEEPALDKSVEEQKAIIEETEKDLEDGNTDKESLEEEQKKLEAGVNANIKLLGAGKSDNSGDEQFDITYDEPKTSFDNLVSNELLSSELDAEFEEKLKNSQAEAMAVIKQLEEDGYDTYMLDYLRDSDKSLDYIERKAEQGKILLEKASSDSNKFSINGLNPVEYSEEQLKALGFTSTSLNKFVYKITLYEDGENLSVLITATNNKNQTVVLGHPIFGKWNQETRVKYFSAFGLGLEGGGVTTRKDLPLSIEVSPNDLSLENTSAGKPERAKQKVNYNPSKKFALESASVNLQISPVMVSTAATLTNADGSTLENPFRGRGFVLYSYNQVVKLDELNIDVILEKGLAENSNPAFKNTFANGIGIMRLDNKPFTFEEALNEFSKVSDNEFRKNINVPAVQRDLAGVFTELLLNTEGVRLDPEIRAQLELFSEQNSVSIDDQAERQKAYNGLLLSANSTENIHAKRMVRDILQKVADNVVLSKVKLDPDAEEEIYLEAINRSADRSVFQYPVIDNSEYQDFVLRVLPGTVTETRKKVKPNAQFNLDHLFALVNETLSENNEIYKTPTLELFDKIFSISNTNLKSGIYLNPRILKRKNSTNKLFAKADISFDDNTINYFQCTVSRINSPQLRVERNLLLSAIEAKIKEQTSTEGEAIELNIPLSKEEIIENFKTEVINSGLTKAKALELAGDISDNGMVSKIELSKLVNQMFSKAIPAKPVVKPAVEKNISEKLDGVVAKSEGDAAVIQSIKQDANIFMNRSDIERALNEISDPETKAELQNILSTYHTTQSLVTILKHLDSNVYPEITDLMVAPDKISKNDSISIIMRSYFYFKNKSIELQQFKNSEDADTIVYYQAESKNVNEHLKDLRGKLRSKFDSYENTLTEFILSPNYNGIISEEQLSRIAKEILEKDIPLTEDQKQRLSFAREHLNIVKEIETIIKEEGVTEENLSTITDLLAQLPEKYTEIFKGSIQPTLDDNLSKEAQDLLNLTLKDYEKLLPSSLDVEEQLMLPETVEDIISSLGNEINLILKLIVDQDKKQSVQEAAKETIDRIRSKYAEQIKSLAPERHEAFVLDSNLDKSNLSEEEKIQFQTEMDIYYNKLSETERQEIINRFNEDNFESDWFNTLLYYWDFDNNDVDLSSRYPELKEIIKKIINC